MAKAPLLACLLPARNAERWLPGWFASVERFADIVIALDDGSTDGTAAMLEAHPLVRSLLRHPQRDDYADWDDAANRNELLSAAAQFAPQWIISIDADERIDESDADRLRQFLTTDALPGCAYGFYHMPMRGDREHFLPRPQRVFRLFSYAKGQRFPDQKLHFAPVPSSIPEALRVQTTLRIQHFGSFLADDRAARAQKYREADPQNRYLPSYDFLRENSRPSDLRRWQPATADAPVLEGPVDEAEFAEFAVDEPNDAHSDTPEISVIIFSQHEPATISRTIESVVNQECDAAFETIVVVTGSPATATVARRHEPRVRVVFDPVPRLPGDARNLGLAEARGKYIVFFEAHVLLEPGNLAARLAAHRKGYGMVTGTVRNGTMTRAGWASYFLDHHLLLPGLPPAVFNGPPPRCSYNADLLKRIGGFPGGVRTAEDIEANREASRLGYVACRVPEVVDVHESRNRRFPRLVRHHLRRGRGWARLMLAPYRERGHAFSELREQGWLTRHMRDRQRMIDEAVQQADPALTGPYRDAHLYVRVGVVAAWLGFWATVLSPRRGWRSSLFGQPVVTWLLVDRADPARSWILRADAATGTAAMIAMPADAIVPVGLDGTTTIGAITTAVRDIPSVPASTLREQTLDAIGRTIDHDVDAWEPMPEALCALPLERFQSRTVGEILGGTGAPFAASDIRSCRVTHTAVDALAAPRSAESRATFAEWSRRALGAPPLPADGRADDPSAWMA